VPGPFTNGYGDRVGISPKSFLRKSSLEMVENIWMPKSDAIEMNKIPEAESGDIFVLKVEMVDG